MHCSNKLILESATCIKMARNTMRSQCWHICMILPLIHVLKHRFCGICNHILPWEKINKQKNLDCIIYLYPSHINYTLFKRMPCTFVGIFCTGGHVGIISDEKHHYQWSSQSCIRGMFSH